MDEKDRRIAELESELDRAYSALCGYAFASECGQTLSGDARAHHAPVVAAAKQHVIDTAVEI